MSRIPDSEGEEIYTVELTAWEICKLMGDSIYIEDELEEGRWEHEEGQLSKNIRKAAIEKLKDAYFPKATKLWNEKREAKNAR